MTTVPVPHALVERQADAGRPSWISRLFLEFFGEADIPRGLMVEHQCVLSGRGVLNMTKPSGGFRSLHILASRKEKSTAGYSAWLFFATSRGYEIVFEDDEDDDPSRSLNRFLARDESRGTEVRFDVL